MRYIMLGLGGVKSKNAFKFLILMFFLVILLKGISNKIK